MAAMVGENAVMRDGSGIRNVTWALRAVVLDGRSVEGVERTGAYLVLGPEHRAYGKGGCNSFFATYHLDGKDVSVGPIGSIRMFCDGAMEVEASFFRALEMVRTARREGDRLELSSEDGATRLSFLRATGERPGDRAQGPRHDGQARGDRPPISPGPSRPGGTSRGRR